jgi:hypothetical protein
MSISFLSTENSSISPIDLCHRKGDEELWNPLARPQPHQSRWPLKILIKPSEYIEALTYQTC